MSVYDDKKVKIGLSGGINSMALLCWLHENGHKPSELHLYYTHLSEHSDDTFRFVAAGVRFARAVFPKVFFKMTRDSVIDYFRRENFIPHPTKSPCSMDLKIIPSEVYEYNAGVEIDLVGFVKSEGRRIKRQLVNKPESLFLRTDFPIRVFNDDWCFQIVLKYIGWYPAIYHILDENGFRVFKHNNCLPCKNMTASDLSAVAKYFPEKWRKAEDLSIELGRHWGRSEVDFNEICDRCSF